MEQSKKNKAPVKLDIPVTSIGSGLLVVFPHTEYDFAKDPDLCKYRILQLESLESDWLSEWIEARKVTSASDSPHGYILLTFEGGVIRAKCRASFKPHIECYRCLEEFTASIDVDASAIYIDKEKYDVNQKPANNSREVALTVDDFDTYVYSGQNLNLDEFILDYFETSIPDFLLCSDQCQDLTD